MVKERAAKILTILKQTFELPSWINSKRDPFETFIETIISQNTADHNTAKAFDALKRQFRITPETLAKAQISQIENTIRPAGLYKSKAKTIKKASMTILEKYHGTLQPILELPLDDARKNLIEFSGVGPKTADVLLLFSARQKTIPVDTHVNRVTKRLGFTPQNADYETVRKSLQTLFDPHDYLAVHLLFIELGRKVCKAPRPLCNQCPVNIYCPSNGLWSEP